MTIRAGVIGASGRMGSATCEAIGAADDMVLAAEISSKDALERLVDGEVAVAVEFTTPTTVKHNAAFCLSHGIHCVIGATGLSESDLADLTAIAEQHSANAFVAPNFAIGAVLMMEFAARAAPLFRTAEIVERHHTKKLDAPSGTALRTAALMNEAKGEPWPPVEGRESLEGSRGGDVDGVKIHSLRVEGSVAHQEVILGGTGETLTIRHDSLDLGSFMPGVLLAIRRVADLPGLTVGLEHLLDS